MRHTVSTLKYDNDGVVGRGRRFNNIILYCYNDYTAVREDPVTLRNNRFNTEFKYNIIILRSEYIFY